MKLRLMAIVSSVVLFGALVGGATFALFTDSKTTTVSYDSGTLAVEIHNAAGNVVSGPGGQPLMTIDDMAPGDTQEFTGVVHNSGSLPLVYSLSFPRMIAPALAAVPTIDPDDALADKLELRVEYAESLDFPEDWEFGLVGDMTIAQWQTYEPIWLKPLNHGADHHFRMTLHLPLETGNAAQGGGNVVSFNVSATQVGTQLAPDTVVTGALPAGQSNFYKIWLSQGQTAVATVTSVDYDPDLYGYGINVEFLGSPFAWGGESTSFTAPADGYYYVRVHAWPGAGSLDDYQFHWTLGSPGPGGV